jgi:hypothetical protein
VLVMLAEQAYHHLIYFNEAVRLAAIRAGGKRRDTRTPVTREA